ncbi:MAG: iron-containing alcohol dehydrogenase [Acidobacteria bacterium]|nr:iron-containing alcohol dehydrogenase [Acidobacteriota bacterium]
MNSFDQAREILRRFKGGNYAHGFGVLAQAGPMAAALGRRAVLVQDAFPGAETHAAVIRGALEAAGVELAGTIGGAAPNAPREDLERIAAELARLAPDATVSFGGGSTIDCAKAAEVLRTLGGSIEDYFGVGLVTAKLQTAGRRLTPHVAIQTAASSGAHLTKYSNITDLKSGQKKLIVDNAIVPDRAIFDYSVTAGAPASLTADGALDGIAHSLEVLYGAVGKLYYQEMLEVARAGIGLVLKYLPQALARPDDLEAREALGLATDLGAYSIMLGGTNGAHLTSFSLIDILSHGRACAILNPYYTVFFAPAIQEPLELVAALCVENGCAEKPIRSLSGRELGLAVARALMAFERRVGVPPALNQVPGFTDAHIERALTAAKNPQLRMKLENMPVPMTAEMVDDYMGPILQAARTGVLEGIRNVS